MVLTGIHQPFGAHLRGGRTSCTLRSRWGLSVGLWPGLLLRGTSQGLPMPLTSPCNGGSVLQGQGDSPRVVKETGLSKEVSVGGTLATSGSTVSSTDVEP